MDVIDLTKSQADIDWIRAARLQKQVDAGDESAYRELLKLEEIRMFPSEDPNAG